MAARLTLMNQCCAPEWEREFFNRIDPRRTSGSLSTRRPADLIRAEDDEEARDGMLGPVCANYMPSVVTAHGFAACPCDVHFGSVDTPGRESHGLRSAATVSGLCMRVCLVSSRGDGHEQQRNPWRQLQAAFRSRAVRPA